MKNKIKLYLCCLFLLLLPVCGACNSQIEPEITTEAITEGEETVYINPEDNYEGTLKIEESADGKTVTISYMLNGKEVSYTVPNNANYKSGGFAATDDVGRALPTSLTSGIYGSNGEKYVGIFYFLWHDINIHGGHSTVYDHTKTYYEGGKDALIPKK